MTILEILSKLERSEGPFPLEAVEEARARREEMTEPLLAILLDTKSRIREIALDEDHIAHFYALYLLAEFKETRAYRLVTDLYATPGDDIETISGDNMPEDMVRVLLGVYDGDDAPIKALIENPEVNERVRGAAIETLKGLVARRLKPRDEVAAYYRRLLMGPSVLPGTHYWNELVSCTADLHPGDSMEEIKRAYGEELVDEGYVTLDEIEIDAESDPAAMMEEVHNDPKFYPIENTVEEMEPWPCFEDWDDELEDEWEDEWEKGLPEKIAEAEMLGGTVRNELPKVGPNEPCPCGSGKKFKKCCRLA